MLTFDDVLIEPTYSDITSRSEIDIGTEFLGLKFKVPLISSNMDFITEEHMAQAMLQYGGFYILHRFMSDTSLYEKAMYLSTRLTNNTGPLSISIGVREPDSEIRKIDSILSLHIPIENLIVTIDVAHGFHQRVFDMVRRLKLLGVPKVIAGNVATADGYLFLAEAGADAVKVGIGPGSVCTTREVTGIGVPQLSAIMDCVSVQGDGPAIISDGGCKNSGDIVKALAAGADMVMIGSLLAGTDEAPGERRVDPYGKTWAPYRGQSIFGVNASHYTPEGISGWVEAKGPLKGTLDALAGGIRSGLSYVGARNLEELRAKAEFVQVSQATHIESGTRVLRELE